jgi:hypothetical protein
MPTPLEDDKIILRSHLAAYLIAREAFDTTKMSYFIDEIERLLAKANPSVTQGSFRWKTDKKGGKSNRTFEYIYKILQHDKELLSNLNKRFQALMDEDIKTEDDIEKSILPEAVKILQEIFPEYIRVKLSPMYTKLSKDLYDKFRQLPVPFVKDEPPVKVKGLKSKPNPPVAKEAPAEPPVVAKEEVNPIPGIRFVPIQVYEFIPSNAAPIRNPSVNAKEFKLADLTLQQIENYSEVINSVSLEETRWIQTFDADPIANTSTSTLNSYQQEYAPDGKYPILDTGFRSNDDTHRFEDWGGYQQQVWDERYMGSIDLLGELKYKEPIPEVGDTVDIIDSTNGVNVIDEFHDRDPVADDDWWMG